MQPQVWVGKKDTAPTSNEYYDTTELSMLILSIFDLLNFQ